LCNLLVGDQRLDKKWAIVPAIAVAALAAGIIIYEQPSTQATNPVPPVNIKVNGNSGPDISVLIKRGESMTMDVLVSPNMQGITTNLEAKLVYPECGTKEAATVVNCTPKGVWTSLSKSSVSKEEHVSLKVEIARDMQTGIFPIQVVANTDVAKGPGRQPLPVMQLFPINLQIT
jgi:hypothetical protein